MGQKEGTLPVSLIIIGNDRNQAQNIIFPLFLEHSQDCFPDQSPLFVLFLTVVNTFPALFRFIVNLGGTISSESVAIEQFCP